MKQKTQKMGNYIDNAQSHTYILNRVPTRLSLIFTSMLYVHRSRNTIVSSIPIDLFIHSPRTLSND